MVARSGCRAAARAQRGESQDAAVLSAAEQGVSEYCSAHPELGSSCWDTHLWLVQKGQEATRPEGGVCGDMLQRTLREILSAGSIDEVYRSLAMLKQIDEHKHGRNKEGDLEPVSTPLPSSAIGEQEHALLVRLFHQLDTNNDGMLSFKEFLAAMHRIDDDLEEEELEVISTALDLNGMLSLEQFLAVVQQAEEARDAGNCDAHRLRHLTHRRPDSVDRLWGSL